MPAILKLPFTIDQVALHVARLQGTELKEFLLKLSHSMRVRASNPVEPIAASVQLERAAGELETCVSGLKADWESIS